MSVASTLRRVQKITFAVHKRRFASSTRELVKSLVRAEDCGRVHVHLKPRKSGLSENFTNNGRELPDCIVPDDLPTGVAEIVVSNPARRNAITARAAIEFAQALDELEAQSVAGAVSAVVVRGASSACTMTVDSMPTALC